MHLPALRRRLLLAMGLPLTVSCGSPQQPPGGGGGDDTIVIGNTKPTPTPGGPCGVDEIPESVCGSTAGSPDGCGPWGTSLTSYGASHLWVTQGSYGAHDPTFAEFALDGRATDAYRGEITSGGGSAADAASYCCYASCTALTVGKSAPLQVAAGYHVEPLCVPPPTGGTTVPAEADARCPAAVLLQGELRPHQAEGELCCYGVAVADPVDEEVHHNRGRAARVDGVARVASVAPRTGWTAAALAPALAALPAATRARLAAVWAETAQMEHASIASFSNLALRLLAVGAPPELIAATHRAALDEIEHARIAFALASAYAGAEVGPAPFDDAARMSAAGGLDALAVETFVDGCIGETVAAAEARWAAGRAVDPSLASVLDTIAEDETRHAELAWAIVAWCVRRGGPAITAQLDRALVHACAAPDRAAAPDLDLASHGIVSARDLAALRRDVLRTVVAPCLAALA